MIFNADFLWNRLATLEWALSLISQLLDAIRAVMLFSIFVIKLALATIRRVLTVKTCSIKHVLDSFRYFTFNELFLTVWAFFLLLHPSLDACTTEKHFAVFTALYIL